MPELTQVSPSTMNLRAHVSVMALGITTFRAVLARILTSLKSKHFYFSRTEPMSVAVGASGAVHAATIYVVPHAYLLFPGPLLEAVDCQGIKLIQLRVHTLIIDV